MLHIPNILTAEQLNIVKEILNQANWLDGKITAGEQSEQVKNNQQLDELDVYAVKAREIILKALGANGLFFSHALPKKIFPPMFNLYTQHKNSFGNHIDNSVRTSKQGMWVRTDLSCTLFISNPKEYEGGELVIEDTLQSTTIKLNAGDLILYPSSFVHRVEPVTKGSRMASFFWVESMVQSLEQRQVLFDMDMALRNLRDANSSTDSQELIQLTGCYHNLLRMWAQP